MQINSIHARSESTRPISIASITIREFMGSYLTYKKLKNNKLDLYYLAFNNNANYGGDFNYDTFGARLKGNWEVWLWDLEGAYQTGNTAGFNHDAEAFTAGLGRNFECVKWTAHVVGLLRLGIGR